MVLQQVDLTGLEAHLEDGRELQALGLHGAEVLQRPLAQRHNPGGLPREPQPLSPRALLIGERRVLHRRVGLEGLPQQDD
jgi:hypothetical protein